MSSEVLTKPAPVVRSGYRRGWFQFGLRSVILLTVACALGVTWWRQWRQNAELESLRSKTVWLERELEIRRAAAEVSKSLNLKNPEHRRIVQLIGRANSFFGDSVIRRQVEWPGRRWEVVVFHHESLASTDVVETIAVLIGGGKLIDYKIHNASAWHEVKLEDGEQSGSIELVFHCCHEYAPDAEFFTERFSISPEGFQRIDSAQSRSEPVSALRTSRPSASELHGD